MKLKSCPFCGSINSLAIETVMRESWFINCRRCQAIGPQELRKKDAVVSWNRRRATIYREISLDEQEDEHDQTDTPDIRKVG